MPGTQLRALKVPGEGQWTLRAWLVDAAGNGNPEASREAVLRYDATVPSGHFAAPSADAPAQVRVKARDDASGLARAEVELRAARGRRWRSLPTSVEGSSAVAELPDEELRDGVYALRATLADAAGNARTVQRDGEGAEATVRLPVRLKTRLVVGRSRSAVRGGRRTRRLVRAPSLRYGSAMRLHGRLTGPDGAALANRSVTVTQRTDARGAAWRPLAVLTTSRTGRFDVLTRSGPRRDVRFRYSGSPTVRGATGVVSMRVRATTSLRANRRSVVNGQEVVFRGRLRGKPLPSSSKLVQLQAFTRGRWSTFANPRARSRTGLFAYRYRFTATRGRLVYRIRAVIPKDGTYPFDTGRSRTVRIRVRGL